MHLTLNYHHRLIAYIAGRWMTMWSIRYTWCILFSSSLSSSSSSSSSSFCCYSLTPLLPVFFAFLLLHNIRHFLHRIVVLLLSVFLPKLFSFSPPPRCFFILHWCSDILYSVYSLVTLYVAFIRGFNQITNYMVALCNTS